MRSLNPLLLVAALAWASACLDSGGPTSNPPVKNPGSPLDHLAGLVVSAPVPASAALRSAAPPEFAGPSGATLVYVSLAPGSVPSALQATITNQATGLVVTTVVVDGGFDPVAIAGSIGDTLALEITRHAAAAVRAGEVVGGSRPPVVVRTSPPRGGHDVPLNCVVVVVFSEPLDSTSVNVQTIALWRDTTRIAGSVGFADSLHLRVEFHPDTLLVSQTDYHLGLSTSIRDLNGLALDSAVTVPFTTGTAPPPTGNLVFTMVSVGDRHACGVTNTGAAYCWGDNSSSQLGDRSSVDLSTTPVPVAGGLTFASVSAGYFDTCGVTTSGAAYCWGVGALGDTGEGFSPYPVAGGLTFASVSAGYVHTCGVTTTGAAYCWGQGYFGELGDGDTTGSATPVPVAGGLTFRVVSAGGNHSCGVTTTGTAYCWGLNSLGELGAGMSTGPEQCWYGDTSSVCSRTPIPVAGGLTFATVSAGQDGTCGVTTSGAVYCWGDDRFGLLGTTDSEQCDTPPTWLPGADPGTVPCSHAPVAVPDGLTLASVSVSAADQGACGLTPAGKAYCWGVTGNLVGGLLSPVAVPGQLSFATLSTGPIAYACGVTIAGVAYCWGVNQYGQLGNGTTAEDSYVQGSYVPVKVAGQP